MGNQGLNTPEEVAKMKEAAPRILRQNDERIEYFKSKIEEEENKIKDLNSLAQKQCDRRQERSAEHTLNTVYDLEKSVQRKKKYVRQLQVLRENYDNNIVALDVVEQQDKMMKLLKTQKRIIEGSKDLSEDIKHERNVLDEMVNEYNYYDIENDYEGEERRRQRLEQMRQQTELEKRFARLKEPIDSGGKNPPSGGGGGTKNGVKSEEEKILDSQVEELIKELNDE